jgi:hypothetical protein
MQLWTAHLLVVSDFDLFKTQQAALKLLPFSDQKRGFWDTAC